MLIIAYSPDKSKKNFRDVRLQKRSRAKKNRLTRPRADKAASIFMTVKEYP